MYNNSKKPVLPFFYDYILPNTVMPNALPIEMGVVNYIHTQFSDRLTTESFFDEHTEKEDSPFKQMFGKGLGDMPNSLGMNGSYLRNRCYHPSVQIYENSVYFGRRNLHRDGFRRYVYPIKLTLHFPRCTGRDNVGSKLNGEYFWKHISESVLKDLRKGDAIVFLDWANENFIEQGDYQNLHEGIRYSGIPKESIVLSVNSFNAQEVYENWFSPEHRLLEVRNLPYILCQISWYYDNNPDIRLNEEIFKSSKNTIRPNYFLMPIRRARDHRLALLYKFASEGLLDKADWSCHDPVSFEESYARANSFPLGYNMEVVKQLHEQIPHSLKDEPGSNYFSVSGWGDQHSKHNLNSYFYVATETYVHGVYKSMTEKVFKAVANFNPFLFLSFPGALQELRSLGFKTFDGFINESYDAEPDNTKRMMMIADEVKRLCAMSQEEIHNWYWSMEDILIHNHYKLLDIYRNEPHSAKFIGYLFGKTRS
jgi:hypothetical protein